MTLQQPRTLHEEAPSQGQLVEVGRHPVLWRRGQQREGPCSWASAGLEAAERAVVQVGLGPRAEDVHDGSHQVLLPAPLPLRQRDLQGVRRVANPGVVRCHGGGEVPRARRLPRKELLRAAH
eukprot:6502912-Pyramimonas_sp.AAC.1